MGQYYIYGPGGLPVEQIGFDGTKVWFHHDQLGSTRLLTDQAGNWRTRYSYDPYGHGPIVDTNPALPTATTPLGYTGQYTDIETGHQYLRARYYDPTTAQFLSRDPITALTREPYGYTYGNPLNATDPSGLWSVDLPGDWCFGTDDDCENPHNGHATPVSQPIVNFAGGALDLNPMFMIAQAVDEPLTGRDIDLAANGVDECSGWYTAGQWSMAIVDVAIPGHAGWTALNSGRGAGIGNFARVARHQAHRAMPSTFKGGPERVARWLAEHPDFRTHWHWTWRGVRSGGK
jgi:RHS repeat-associated protein